MLKKVLAGVVAAVVSITTMATVSLTSALAAEITDQGSCGDNATWTIDSEGLCMISGSGNVSSTSSIRNHASDLKELVVENDISGITAGLAFNKCVNLTKITLKESVASVSKTAFKTCTGIQEVYIYSENFTAESTAFDVTSNPTFYVIEGSATETNLKNSGYTNIAYISNEEPTPEIIDQGSCGDNATWTIDSEGLCVISGSGNVSSTSSIRNHASDLKELVVENDISGITAGLAFNKCVNLTKITLKESVASVSKTAFKTCTGIQEVYIYSENFTAESTAFDVTSNPTFYVIEGSATETNLKNSGYTNIAYISGSTPSLDYAELNQAIADGEAIDTSKYTEDSVKILTDAIAAGKTVKENTSATQTDVDNAVQAIKDAIDGLKEPLDYTALDQTIYDAETMDTEKYTSATVEILTNAIATGKAVKESASATQEDVNNAVQAIKDAIERLREPVDFTELDKQIARAEEILTHREEYVSVYSVEYALGFAQRVRNDIYAMQSEADTWATNLNNNINNLVKIDVPAMLAELRSVITSAEALDANEYTDDSYQVLADAIEAGKAMNEDSNYQDILDAQSNIEKAVKSLILKPLEEYARVYKNGKVAIIASGKADSAMTGATSVRITFNCASDVSYNNNASIELKAIVAGTESYEKFIGKGDYTTGTNGWTETLALTNPISEGQSYEVSAFTYAWSNASDYVYAVSKVEFLDADGNVLSKVTANTQAFSELQEAIAEAEKIDVSKYTDESVAVLTSALETAKALTDKATIADVTSAKESIEKAVATLELKPIPKGKITGMIIVSDGNSETEMIVVAVSADGTETGVTATSMGSYTIENLEAGDYTLTISGGKYAPRSYEITVAEGENTQNVNLNPYGDINGDGEITTADVGMANAHAKGVTMLIDYEFICANVKLDESITTADVGMINSHAKGVQTLW